MRLKAAMALQLLAEAAIAPSSHHHAVVSPHMKKKGSFRPHVGKEKVGHSGGHHSGKVHRHGGVKGKTLPITHPHVHLIHAPKPPHAIKADASATDATNRRTGPGG